MSYVYYSNALYHHGIKGQKKGIRRWQNEDGTLTEAGRIRYYGAANAVQRDIDNIRTSLPANKNGISAKEKDEIIKGLEAVRDRNKQRGDDRRARDFYKMSKRGNGLVKKLLDIIGASKESIMMQKANSIEQFIDEMMYGSICVDGALNNASKQERIDYFKKKDGSWDERPTPFKRRGNI